MYLSVGVLLMSVSTHYVYAVYCIRIYIRMNAYAIHFACG